VVVPALFCTWKAVALLLRFLKSADPAALVKLVMLNTFVAPDKTLSEFPILLLAIVTVEAMELLVKLAALPLALALLTVIVLFVASLLLNVAAEPVELFDTTSDAAALALVTVVGPVRPILVPLWIVMAPAAELPIATVPFDVPVLILVLKLLEALMLVVAPEIVAPRLPVSNALNVLAPAKV